MTTSARFHPDEPCRNCGDATPGNYCPNCGQAKRDVAVSVGVLVRDILEDQLVLSRTLPTTVRALLLKPGLLTTEYLVGRRVRYIAPFRLYLACSVVFFLLFGTFGLRSLGARSDAIDAGVGAAAAEELQPWATTLDVNLGSAETNQRVLGRIQDRWGRLPPAQALRAFVVEYLRYVPQAVFVLLPLFALVLKGLYRRSGRLYAEHFVFSLHVHAFAFAVAIVAIPFGVVFGPILLATALAVYVWLALRTVYRQGPIRTTVKWFGLGLVYSVFLQFALVATMAVTFLRL